MESKRQQQVARQIQKDMGEILQQDARHMLNGAFVTVTAVRMSPDLSIARVYLSFLVERNHKEVLEHIRANARPLRQKLGERVRHQLRIVPELHFYRDDTSEYTAKMDALFEKLEIPPTPDDEGGKPSD